MAHVILPSRVRFPGAPGNVYIDWGHPLAQGLRLAILPLPGSASQAYNYANPAAQTDWKVGGYSGNASVEPTPYGLGALELYNSSDLNHDDFSYSGETSISMAWTYVQNMGFGEGHILHLGGHYIKSTSQDGSYTPIARLRSGSGEIGYPIPMASGVLMHVVAAWPESPSGAIDDFLVNNDRYSPSGWGAGEWRTDLSNLQVFRGDTGWPSSNMGHCFHLYFWHRALTMDEKYWITSEPYAFFRTASRRIVSRPAVIAVYGTDFGTLGSVETSASALTSSINDVGSLGAIESLTNDLTSALVDLGSFSAVESANVGVLVLLAAMDSGVLGAQEVADYLVVLSAADAGGVSAGELSDNDLWSVLVDLGILSAGQVAQIASASDLSDGGVISASEIDALLVALHRADVGSLSAAEMSVIVALRALSRSDVGTVAAIESTIRKIIELPPPSRAAIRVTRWLRPA